MFEPFEQYLVRHIQALVLLHYTHSTTALHPSTSATVVRNKNVVERLNVLVDYICRTTKKTLILE